MPTKEAVPKSFVVTPERIAYLSRLLASQNIGWEDDGPSAARYLASGPFGALSACMYRPRSIVKGFNIGLVDSGGGHTSIEVEMYDPPYPFRREVLRAVVCEAEDSGQLAFVIDPVRFAEVVHGIALACISATHPKQFAAAS